MGFFEIQTTKKRVTMMMKTMMIAATCMLAIDAAQEHSSRPEKVHGMEVEWVKLTKPIQLWKGPLGNLSKHGPARSLPGCNANGMAMPRDDVDEWVAITKDPEDGSAWYKYFTDLQYCPGKYNQVSYDHKLMGFGPSAEVAKTE